MEESSIVWTNMKLDAKAKLCRFCYLGSMQPVYVHLRGLLDVPKYFPQVSELCKALNLSEFLLLISDIIQQPKLVRRDEVLFVYAAYLASDLDMAWKTGARHAFPAYARTDNDLFIFCKYGLSIQKFKKRKGFSRTMRKAITSWYEVQSPAAIQNMWMQHRGSYGLTHKILLQMCHINDETIGASGVVFPFFNTCKELLQLSDSSDVVNVSRANKKKTSTPTTESVAKKRKTSVDCESKEEASSAASKEEAASEEAAANFLTPQQTPTANSVPNNEASTSKPLNTKRQIDRKQPTCAARVLSMSLLRTTENEFEALKIIKKYQLHYSQVPGHLYRYAPIMEALIPTMSYLQLLMCWRKMARFNLFNNSNILDLCQAVLDNKNTLAIHNIHPVVLLMKLDAAGVRKDQSKVAPKKVEAMRMSYLRDVYIQSFGHNQSTGLRIHVTINFQKNYMKKRLPNHRNLTYCEAAIALAFGYYKKDTVVDVFHFGYENFLLPVLWNKEMNVTEAMDYCGKIKNNRKNNQRLVLPLLNVLPKKKVYDLFLVIVPSAGRSNPKQKSEFLCKFLDKYRDTVNQRAKFVIVNLRKFKRSMTYSEERKENILEICGLDEHTPYLIDHFALNRFD